MVARVRGMIRPNDLVQLRANRERQRPVQGTEGEIDHQPVVRLFLPFSGCVWLLSELDDEGVAFGLCDLGVGFPELGLVALSELEEVGHPQGIRVVQDLSFKARVTIGEYARRAVAAGRIIAS